MSSSSGSSNGSPSAANAALPPPEASTSYAPYRPIPRAGYASVEYPSTVSHPSAILRLVSQEDINECFNTAINKPTMLEIKFGGSDRSGVPIRGNRVPSQKLLLKISRRRRRREQDEGMGTEDAEKGPVRPGAEEGIFTSEIVGPIPQTVRFRSMADWKYTPNPEGRISALAAALRDLDYDQILAYTVPPTPDTFFEPATPNENDTGASFRSLLDLQPPAVFSERRVPFLYNFKNHPATYVDLYEDSHTGEIKKRYANKSRFVANPIQKISHNFDPAKIPSGPKKNMQAKIPQLDQRILARLRQLLEIRPVWARHALMAQFTEDDQRTIRVSKWYLPAVVYTFGAGPYWKTVVRYGYDPRADPSSAQWQRIYFYINVTKTGRLQALDEDSESEEENTKGHQAWLGEEERLVKEGRRPPIDPSKGHLFDGQVLHRDQADYQLCDITDPLIQKIIKDPKNLRDVCDPRSGWYDTKALDLIKALTRIKFTYIKDHHEPAPDDICHATMIEFEKMRISHSRLSNEKEEASEDAMGDEGLQGIEED